MCETIFMTIPSQSELKESQYIGIPVVLSWHVWKTSMDTIYVIICMISRKLSQVYLTTAINLTASWWTYRCSLLIFKNSLCITKKCNKYSVDFLTASHHLLHFVDKCISQLHGITYKYSLLISKPFFKITNYCK